MLCIHFGLLGPGSPQGLEEQLNKRMNEVQALRVLGATRFHGSLTLCLALGPTAPEEGQWAPDEEILAPLLGPQR
ncbi:hypothetical protein J1605_003410 [Eschrichtius robustus]|uniref:Uncharacterized protein n=1 Tax=Eschrichtius robustus TaxID=9764 RepID=A0AB34HT38_ESCRO|nr:hypothetical protein J1605_003410 [Eschrichtius robustus]